ncbi:phosphatase PAP2 family protein [Paeniglutamicibacter kerguelensis]|uniref:Undecaprenyl-diphosphatase n=1 Tax=Paeniglutamicibacter kerguelensis TaxID=254788 RepID=A0ABS4XJ82_9MICC|nr:phosphatase PAP2 family protein [Paeniglutamicibacter kerguelensis]MBP2388521.1 undecaprenyl-diphosphatase [Paeniglutamicibacter kerguelensis]
MNTPRRRGPGRAPSVGSIFVLVLALTLGLFGVARRLWVSARMGEGIGTWDVPTLEWMVAHRTPVATNVAWFFSTLGSAWGMTTIALLATGFLAWRTRSYWPVLLIGFTAAGSVALTVLLKNLTARARPLLAQVVEPLPTSYAFPSGHTLNATAILGVVGYLLFLVLRSQLARILSLVSLGILVLAIGWSRIYLGHHWLTDVLQGLLIGGAWAAIVISLHHFVVLKNRRFAHWIMV